MPLPFRLEEGIYFENSQLLLPWGAPLEFLEWVYKPRIEKDRLSWPARRCFGGQQVAITVVKNAFYNANGVLETVFFERDSPNPQAVFTTYTALFERTIGPPTQVRDDGTGRLTYLWQLNEVQLIVGVGERFTDFVIFSIHQGEPIWQLRP